MAAHLKGEVHIGLYPLLDGDRCWWLVADFDGPDALADALMYLKAARALQVPAALEVSRSGVGAHAWVFFTSPVPAETARRLGRPGTPSRVLASPPPGYRCRRAVRQVAGRRPCCACTPRRIVTRAMPTPPCQAG